MNIYSFTCVNWDGRHHINASSFFRACEIAVCYATEHSTQVKEICFVAALELL